MYKKQIHTYFCMVYINIFFKFDCRMIYFVVKLFLLLVLILLPLDIWGQGRWEIESIGLSYGFNFSDKQEGIGEPGLRCYNDYSLQMPSVVMSMRRNNFILRSAIGISSYEIGSKYESKGGITSAELSTFNLMLSQKAGYRLLNWGIDDSFFFNFSPLARDYHSSNYIAIPIIFSVSPLVGIEYHQQLKELRNSRGFEDLNGNEAREWIKEFDLAALRSRPNKSNAFLWSNVGIGLEATFFGKVGLFYDFTYNMRILGKYKLEVDHVYHGSVQSNTYNFESKYISHTIGIQYFF
ncbi:hypothetical protein [Parabacteroides sp.]